MIERITPEMVKAAYEKTGLKPTKSRLLTDEGFACGLGAIAAAGDGVNLGDDQLKRWQDAVCWLGAQVERNYRWGFEDGFDGDPRSSDASNQERYSAGFQDGQAAAAAVFVS